MTSTSFFIIKIIRYIFYYLFSANLAEVCTPLLCLRKASTSNFLSSFYHLINPIVKSWCACNKNSTSIYKNWAFFIRKFCQAEYGFFLIYLTFKLSICNFWTFNYVFYSRLYYHLSLPTSLYVCDILHYCPWFVTH